jgi:hypothetical protein
VQHYLLQNSEIYNLCNEYDAVNFIKLVRLRWAGHVMGMEKREPAQKSFLPTKPGGREDRRRGRPKFKWCDELEEDVAMGGCRNL